MTIAFEWDETKASSNKVKHGVSFELAIRAFADPFALTQQDRFEQGECRWQTIGLVEGRLLLLVAHTITDANGHEVVRIISARKAESHERRRYEQHRSLSY